jgi:hypothetical protein
MQYRLRVRAGFSSLIEVHMTKKPGDTTPEPAGGRASERLKMFKDAREPARDEEGDIAPNEPRPTPPQKTTPTPPTKKKR